MYGLPDHDPFSRLIRELCRPHPHHAKTPEGERNSGTEQALLEVLHTAITSSMGRGSAAGAARTRSPMDLGALRLRDDIVAVVEKHTSHLNRTPLIPRLESWATAVSLEAGDRMVLEEHAMEWRTAIRELVEPPTRVALRGAACPACGCTHVETPDEDGVVLFDAALLIHLSETPVRGECRVCASTWHGGELLDLQAAISLVA